MDGSPSTPRPSMVLFDLDGTLADPGDGITGSMRHMLAELGVREPRAEVLDRLVGPPLREALAHLLGSDDPLLLERAVTLYRERYREWGWKQSHAYPGVPDLLRRLSESGLLIAVVTNKPDVFAEMILERLGLLELCAGVYGPGMFGRVTGKAGLVACALARHGVSPDRVVMVGDRAQDIVAARAHDVRAVAVGWGFAESGELDACHPARRVEDVTELGAALAELLPV